MFLSHPSVVFHRNLMDHPGISQSFPGDKYGPHFLFLPPPFALECLKKNISRTYQRGNCGSNLKNLAEFFRSTFLTGAFDINPASCRVESSNVTFFTRSTYTERVGRMEDIMMSNNVKIGGS